MAEFHVWSMGLDSLEENSLMSQYVSHAYWVAELELFLVLHWVLQNISML